MAITINSFPAGIAFSRNPIVLEASSDAYVNTAGVKAKWRITFDSNMGNADTLTMESPIMGSSVVLTGATPANDFGEVLPLSTETLAEWIDNNFLPALRENTKIDSNYEVYRSGNFALLEAREFGVDYNFSTFTASGFSITLFTVAGVDEDVEADFFLRVRVCVSTNFTSGLFTQKSEWLFFKPDAAGELSVDLSKIADKLLSDLDDYSIVVGYGAPAKSQRKMYVQVGEYYGSTPDALHTETTSTITLVKGGTHYLHEYIGIWGAGAKWVTNRRRIPLGLTDYDWVYFLYRKAGTTGMKVMAKAYYTDNTDATLTYQTDTTSTDYDVKRVPINFTSLGLNALNPSKTCYKYEIWLAYMSGATVSDTITVDVVPSVEASRMMYYYNTFGMIEGLLCTGVRRREREYKRERSLTRMAPGADYNNQPETDYGIESRDAITLNSHPLLEHDFLAASELFNSKKFWLVQFSTEYGIAIVPSNLIPGSIDHPWTSKTGEMYKSLEVKLQLPLESNNSISPWV